jgi:hypothetical protein
VGDAALPRRRAPRRRPLRRHGAPARGFVERWGLARTPAAARAAGRAGLALGAVLAIAAIAALLAFARHAPEIVARAEALRATAPGATP